MMSGRVVCAAFAALLMSSVLFGQSQNATLDGQVSDKTGAVIPQATVTITASERSTTQTVQTDNDGRYSFPNLQPGMYNLTVEAKGFQTSVQRGLQLLANQSARVDSSLE